MHDQQLERNLRAALRAEGDGLAFTITAAELERRLALRRRGRPSLVGFGLAAAVAIGLLGLAGIVGGWFDPRTVIAPAPQPSASPAASPAAIASASPAPVSNVLPSLDDLITAGDPDSVVLAQQSGPADGQLQRAPDSPMTDLGPLAGPADYAITYACIGRSEAYLLFEPDPPANGLEDLRTFTCDGSIQSALVHIDEPMRLRTGTNTPSSWRFVVRPAVANGPPHVSAISMLEAGLDEQDLLTNSGQHLDPDYSEIQTGGGIVTPIKVGGLPSREDYRVRVSCAGPSPLSYTFGANGSETEFVSYLTTQVLCDGAIHEGRFDIPLPNGAEFFVATDDRNAWNLLVTSAEPPVSIAPDEGGWGMSMAIGPTLEFDPHSNSLSSAIEGPDRNIRIVVSCLGGHAVDVEVTSSGKKVGTFKAACEPDQAQTSSANFRLPTAGFEVNTMPDSKMWLAVTVQTREVANQQAP
jgi:hypothetical protein